MVQLTAFALALAAFTLGAQAGPCATCNPVNIIQDGSFEDASSTAWTFDSGVTVQTDAPGADYSVSGTNYVSFNIAQREDRQRYSISQQLTGLKPNQPYTLQFTWELTDASGIYDGGVDIQTQLDGVQVDFIGSSGRGPLDQVTLHTVTITPTSSTPVLRISCGGGGNYYYGATIAIDDISLGKLCAQ
ncbi:uncharacterized protein SPSK_11012 [Sporothrix schenckii 1099-18]|uniref:CBM-cenC domain-containing protein n=1 Tax=Sporothrix schenckii 1099-18 TaxID=1397361 RepID=A0A0F2MAA3_SPOSC|nr:uncharacterized protein SPSK_11012 [Sporothrix schenckii 1099-18]KJR85091.1 hypothetical protein SPSK_11012 [Sporothrix schenckii 1099-18]